MNYKETIEKIHGFQRFGSRLGLERMTALMDILGNPQDNMKIIHVAGTNGKGSVCRYLASMLQENGYKTGVYTSPYLERFTERIEFNGIEISDDDLVSCASEVFNAIEIMLAKGYESPTEFELVTAIGFVYFNRKPTDILILEVGLGGRGDSTNIIKNPLVSVITSISYDHTNVLGDSLAQIAWEKSGIIKKGCPVISGVDSKEASEVIQNIARERNCYFFDATKIKAKDINKSLSGYSFAIEPFTMDNGDHFLKDLAGMKLKLKMIGMHQISNAICAISVIELLQKRGIITYENQKLTAGIEKAFQKGRLEILRESPLILADGAHNAAGAKALTDVIRDHFNREKTLVVAGMLKEKDVGAIVEELSKISGEFVATEPDNPLKIDAWTLCNYICKAGNKCTAVGNCGNGYRYIVENMGKYDVIIITGSLYLIGRLRGLLLQ